MSEVGRKGVEAGNYPYLLYRYIVGISNVVLTKMNNLLICMFVCPSTSLYDMQPKLRRLPADWRCR